MRITYRRLSVGSNLHSPFMNVVVVRTFLPRYRSCYSAVCHALHSSAMDDAATEDTHVFFADVDEEGQKSLVHTLPR